MSDAVLDYDYERGDKLSEWQATAALWVDEEPDEGGEYRCLDCGTPGEECLYLMNSTSAQTRCCGWCLWGRLHEAWSRAASATL